VAFSFVVAVGLVNGAMALPHWLPVQPRQLAVIVLIASPVRWVRCSSFRPFRVASPARVAPFEYTALLWGLMFDWVLWRTLPDQRTLIGGAVVTASGLYVIYREHLRSTVVVHAAELRGLRWQPRGSYGPASIGSLLQSPGGAPSMLTPAANEGAQRRFLGDEELLRRNLMKFSQMSRKTILHWLFLPHSAQVPWRSQPPIRPIAAPRWARH